MIMIMKVLIWVILLISGQVIGTPSQRNVDFRNSEKKLSKFLEHDLRQIMRDNITSYDPYQSKQQIVNLKNRKISFKGKFNNFNIKNLSHYVVKKSNFNYYLRRMKIDLDFPIITSSGLYDIDALYQKTPFIGKGQYNLTVTNFSINAVAGTNFFGDFQIKSLNLNITPGKFDISATNDNFDDNAKSKEWSRKLSNMIPKMITANHKAITSFLSKKLIVIINEQLRNNKIFQ